jgi:hypothetical protein
MSTEYDAKAKEIARLAFLIGEIGEPRIEAAEAFGIILRLLPECEALQELKREIEILHEIRSEQRRAYCAYQKTLPHNDDDLPDFEF